MTKTNLLNDTLRIRLSSKLKDNLITEAAKLNMDLSELVRDKLYTSTTQRTRHFKGCLDCHTFKTPWYIVRDSIWKEAIPNYNEIKKSNPPEHPIELCFDCLEKRLGRQLTIDDFDLTKNINTSLLFGFMMGIKYWLDGDDAGDDRITKLIDGLIEIMYLDRKTVMSCPDLVSALLSAVERLQSYADHRDGITREEREKAGLTSG